MGSKRKAKSMRLASQASWKAAASPIKENGRSAVATVTEGSSASLRRRSFHYAVGRAVDELEGASAKRYSGDYANNLARFNSRKVLA
jgi:hypothetical protein